MLTENKPINIKKLVMPEPVEEVLPIDFGKVFNEIDWKNLHTILQEADREGGGHLDFAINVATRMLTLFPDRKTEFAQDLSPLPEKLYMATLVSSPPSYLKLLFPSQYEKLADSFIFTTDFGELRREIQGNIALGRLSLVGQSLFKAFIFHGFHENEIEHLSTPQMRTVLEDQVQLISPTMGDTNLADGARAAAMLRIYFGKESLHLSSDQWALLKETLRRFRKENKADFFTELAFNLGLVVAQKLTVTDSGLEIDFPKNQFAQVTEPLPHVRKF